MQAIILAAGMGKRLGELTQNNTKCMVKVNGVALIDRMLHQLDRLYLTRIVIVIGYEGKKLIDHIGTLDIQTRICFVENPIYSQTNNIYSLALAKEYLVQDNTLLLESDLIFEDDVLSLLLEDGRETLALVDKYESWMDGTCIKIESDDSIAEFIPGKKFVFDDISEYYKTVNIYKFSRQFSKTHYVPFLEAYVKALGNNEYYEQVLQVIAMLDAPEIRAKRLDGQLWYEIDDIQDLDIASSMFLEDEAEKVKNIQSRYGGYWRYPRLIDFCNPVNPYFPPQKLMSEMKANYETLLTQHPSGMKVNSLLAAKNFGVKPEHVLVGNGAAELIKGLMQFVKGSVGFIRPTLEEYLNRWDVSRSIFYESDSKDFHYTAEDLMIYFTGKEITTLIVANPDDFSGNYIPKADILRLIDWCRARDIRLVLDESFVDFAEEADATILQEEILSLYTKLTVIKSISKSYGVPGVRLGILASVDKELMDFMKKEVVIWNINSFGEFYMQIMEKYQKDYEASLDKIKGTRRIFMEELSQNSALRVYPSQGNYIMAEIVNGMTAVKVTERVLLKHHILIKDLSGKAKERSRQFVRLSVRSEEDNGRLLRALEETVL